MYEIKNLSYSIGKNKILDDININIKPNNFLSIIGPNGCGKSTLLKTINRSINIQKGSILLNKKDINIYSDKDLALKRAVLNQSFSFPYNFKAIEIVEMGLYIYNFKGKEKKRIIDYIVNKLDLESLKDKDYINLSGGEKQKIQFARVIVQLFASEKKEKYLFLDEPTLNLDIYYQFKILDLTKELIEEFQIGVCAVLHDINQAYLYSDEVAMIQKGKIKYHGKTKDVLSYENIYDIFKVESDFIYSNKFKSEMLITLS